MSNSLEKTVKRLIKLRSRNSVIAAVGKAKSKVFDAPSLKSNEKKVRKPRGMTMDELLSVCKPNIQANAKRDQVKITKLISRLGKIYSESLTYDTSKIPVEVRLHKHYIEKYDIDNDRDKKFYQSKLKITCDCEYSIYWCEYALTHRGASWIKFSNGEFPIVRNPQNRPLICKHMFVLLNKIKRDKI